jgi:hypothetical protein
LSAEQHFLVRRQFKMHSGGQGFFKIECDALTDEEIKTGAVLIHHLVGPFGSVVGVPRGGLRLAEALNPYLWGDGPPLVVDDVLSTGQSMEAARVKLAAEGASFPAIKGAVLFSRGRCPPWIVPVFQMTLERERVRR